MPENFLDLYLRYAGLGECPENFHRWCGLFTLSVTLGRRCWVPMNRFKVFPNMYMIVVGDPGRQRKSTAIDISSDILAQLQPRPNLIAQKITPQALIDSLRTFDVDLSGKKLPRERAEGYLVCDELKNFLDRTGYEAGLGPMLTAFFDCKPLFEYKTKKDGSQILRDVCFGMLGGSTVTFLREAIPESAIGTGVTSRIIFVSSDEAPPGVPIPQVDNTALPPMLEHLSKAQSLSGEFLLAPEAINYYMRRYIEHHDSDPLFQDQYLAGYASRRWTLAFKVAMSLAIADSPDLRITLANLEMADRMLANEELRMPKIMRSLTSSDQGNTLAWVERVIESYLKDNAVIEKRLILIAVASKINTYELDAILQTLEQMGKIKLTYSSGLCHIEPGPNQGRKKT